MKNIKLIFLAILAIALFSSCETVNSSGQPIISYGEAFAAQWKLDFWYAFQSIAAGILLAGYVFYISKYKEWETGTIIIGMVLLAIFTGIMFGTPITTHLNTTREAVGRGNYVM